MVTNMPAHLKLNSNPHANENITVDKAESSTVLFLSKRDTKYFLAQNDSITVKKPRLENKLEQFVGFLTKEFGVSVETAKRTFEGLKPHFDETSLPERPLREYRSREGIINYIRADDGLGPWWKAGKLTRPLIRELSPAAYVALSNWLRNNDLPPDIVIPKKSQTVDQRSIGEADIRNAYAIINASRKPH
jgi:hypothetical protein